MNNQFDCSYLVTTYNKHEILATTLEHLFANKRDNIEIVVSDGCSSDETVDYLKSKYDAGLIDTLILSEERDGGEWVGYKKCLEAARGTYIKFITDDDVFDYDQLNKCLDFLVSNPTVDWLYTDGYWSDIGAPTSLIPTGYYNSLYSNNVLQLHREPEGLCGLGFFIKKEKALEIEILDGSYGARTDKGISMKLYNSNLKVALTDLRTYVRVQNAKSNSVLNQADLENPNFHKHSKDYKITAPNYDYFVEQLVQRRQPQENFIIP
jgi:glycosyltransferase involved in cell wall biosynthesis